MSTFPQKKEGTRESPLFLLCPYFLHRGNLSLFLGERGKGKGEIFRDILHFWENFRDSGVMSYKAVFPDEKVFDPRSGIELAPVALRIPLVGGSCADGFNAYLMRAAFPAAR